MKSVQCSSKKSRRSNTKSRSKNSQTFEALERRQMFAATPFPIVATDNSDVITVSVAEPVLAQGFKLKGKVAGGVIGVGSFRVSAGADVTGGGTRINGNPGSPHSLTVSGAGSTWLNSEQGVIVESSYILWKGCFG